MDISNLTKRLHKFERKSSYVNHLFTAICLELNKIVLFLSTLTEQFFFDTLTIALPLYERMMNIPADKNLSINDRRSIVQARWRSTGHNSIKLIQEICKCFKNGEIQARFIDGKIQLKFIDSYGIPSQVLLLPLIQQINQIKPAHIPLAWIYKFLLKKEIHNKLTKKEIQTMTKNTFCEVKTNE